MEKDSALIQPHLARLNIPGEEGLRRVEGFGDWRRQKSTSCLGDSETVSLFCEETLGGLCQGSHVFVHGSCQHQACTLVEPLVSVPWFPYSVEMDLRGQ